MKLGTINASNFFMSRLTVNTLWIVGICLALASVCPGTVWAQGAGGPGGGPGGGSGGGSGDGSDDGSNKNYENNTIFSNTVIFNNNSQSDKIFEEIGTFVLGGLQTRATPSTVVFRAIAKAAAQAKEIAKSADTVMPKAPEFATVPIATTDKISAMRALLNPSTQLVQPQQFAVGRLPEQELDAIKWVLVEEALKVPTRVVPKAWIDQNGQLQEGTQVPNGMKVRGVRISNFLGNGTGEVVDRIATDETVADLTQVNILVKNTLSRLASVVPNGMKVQGVRISNFLGNGTGEVVDRIATDETVADLTQVNIYFVPQDQRWMQSVSFTSDLSDSIRGDNRYFASKMLSEWLTQWDDAARTRSVGWSQSAHAPSSQGVYQAALQGEKKAEMAEWELSMRVHKFTPNLPLQVPALTTTLGATSVPAKTTYWQADWVLTKRGQQQAIWQYSQQLVWDVDALSLLPPDVPQTVINSMRLGSASGVQGINTLMSREPMQFSLLRQEGQYWTISGGSQNGLRVGDTLVLVNSRELLEPVLQASVTQGLALGEVVQVGAVRSTIRQVAGSKLPMSSAGSWMVIPY